VSAHGAEYFAILLRRLARDLEKLESVRLETARWKLRPAHVSLLGALLEASPLTPGELAGRCELEPSTLTGLLRALEQQKLIQREKVLLDQRTQAIALTARGKAAAKAALRVRAQAQAALLRGLPRSAKTVAPQVLGQLAASAQKAAELALQRQRAKERRAAV